MAAEKKAVVIYTNWITTFEKLSDEEAGRLVKHIFRYVNDLNPEPPDRLTELVFEPFKQILKIDLQKYEAIREKRRLSGSMGGAPKGNANAGKKDKTSKTTKRLKKQAKQPVIVKGNVKGNVLSKDNDKVDTNVSTMSNEKSHPTNEGIDYKKLVDYFNQKTNGVFGVVRYPISELRKGMIRARIREHGKEAFIEMIEKAIGSNFLKGDNRSGFRAKFDWLVKPSNFQKVIEGNYNNSVTHNDSLLTHDQVVIMVGKGETTFDKFDKVQTGEGKIYYKKR